MTGLYPSLKMTYLITLLLSLATLHYCKAESYVAYIRGDTESKLIIHAPHGGPKMHQLSQTVKLDIIKMHMEFMFLVAEQHEIMKNP